MMSPLKSVGHWHLNSTPLYLLSSTYIESDHDAYVYTLSIILIITFLVINGIITHAVAH